MLCKLEPGAPRDPPFAPAPSLPLGLIAGFGNGPLPLRRGSCHAHSARQRRRDVEDLLTVESISPEVDGRLDAVHCLHHLVQAVAFASASRRYATAPPGRLPALSSVHPGDRCDVDSQSPDRWDAHALLVRAQVTSLVLAMLGFLQIVQAPGRRSSLTILDWS